MIKKDKKIFFCLLKSYTFAAILNIRKWRLSGKRMAGAGALRDLGGAG